MSRVQLPCLQNVPWNSLRIGDEVRHAFRVLPRYQKKPAQPMTGVITGLEIVGTRIHIQWDDGQVSSGVQTHLYDVRWKGPMIASRIR